ncbi:Hypothetical protein A7982_02634 [Minicystis rosea]|nr:Hypothetical protein A7982_02634 [Minicystis rosea]
MTNRWIAPLLIATAFTAACAPRDETTPGSGGGGQGGAAMSVRGARYCEILVGHLEGANVRIDVFNTFGLNECPEEAWSNVDEAAVAQETGATSVVLNGPRHWVVDGFVNSSFLDPTVVTLGGIEMRKAGQITLPLSEVANAGKPYLTREVARNTTYVFDAGKSVYEMVDADGRIFVMQSFSLEQEALTESDLPGLSSKLTLPAGWMFRTRTLTAELQVTAVDGVATIVQDQLESTYQLSKP